MGLSRDLEELAHRLGGEYHAQLPVESLLFTDPPWAVRHGWRGPPTDAWQVLLMDAEQGFFVVADFLQHDISRHAWTQTVAGLRLHALPRGLETFVDGLELSHGLRCVLREDCIYVFVDNFSHRRSPRLDFAERVACLEALEAAAAGDYERCRRALETVPGSLLWGWVNRVFAAAVWGTWLYFAATTPNALPGMLVLGLALLTVHVGVYAKLRHQFRFARAYADRRTR